MSLLDGVRPSKQCSLKVRQSMDRIQPTEVRKSLPVFIKAVKITWFQPAEVDQAKFIVKATD